MSTTSHVQTYLSPPTKIKCPNSKCAQDLYYYPPTKINDVKTPLNLSCAACGNIFPPANEPSRDAFSKISIAQSHYETLGVERSATPDEISRAYRKKSLQCHPD